MKFSRTILVLALLVTTAASLWLVLSLPVDFSRDREGKPKDTADAPPRRPPPQSVARWLQVSNDKHAVRAADYQLDAPRPRNEQGQALPFRERPWPAARLRALQDAKEGDEIVLELFDDVSFRARVTGRWEDAGGFRLAARLEGRGPKDRFFMSWGGARGRGLVELPSINRAYEIISSGTGGSFVLEWLYTDVVCATPAGVGADAGLPTPASPVLASAPRIAAGDVPPLESRPGAVAVIYIDFDGEVVSGTAWASGATINAPAARMDAAQITETWERVSRDFAPFNVNVTTIRSVYDAAPGNRRTHCVVTEDDTAASGAGGVAYLDSFADADPVYKICWSFIDNNARNCAVVVSHEVGHTLDLEHDGRVASGSEPREEYYRGHGTGPTGWAPIMGVGYYQQLVQWSKGEYARANNPEDDLAIITAARRIPYVTDDHGGSTAQASDLTSGVVLRGLVERSADADYFRLLVGTGPQPVSVTLPVGTMLDVELKIFAEDGSLLETVNPPGELAATTELNFPTTRTVFLSVAGTGKPEVLGTGYSAYSSLGSYTLLAGTPFPGRVTGVFAAPASDSAINVSWDAAPAAASYIVRRDGADITNSSARSIRDAGLSESTTYTYEVVATNGTGAAAPSDPVSATTLSWAGANPYGFRVTNPSAAFSTNAKEYVFRGQLGAALTGTLIYWTNAGRGLSGTFAGEANWSQLIALGAGTNRVMFSTSYQRPLATNVSAYDAPGDLAYRSGAWLNGANGGYGFGPWSNATTAAGASLAVVDNFAATNMNSGGFHGFALRAGTGSSAIARRPFDRPLEVGESFTVNFDNNTVVAGGSVGFALSDANGVDRLSFSASGNLPSSYVVGDSSGAPVASGIARTTDGLLPVTVTLVTSNSYLLRAGTNPPVAGLLAGSNPVSQVRLYNNSAGAAEADAFYIGNMSVLGVVTTNQRLAVVAPFVIQSGLPVTTDGLPDAWWESFGIPMGSRVAAADFDGDGFSNAQEYTLGTDPSDVFSLLAITSMHYSEGNLSIGWSAVAGKAYMLETSTVLPAASSGWAPVGAVLVAPAGSTNIFTNLPVTGPQGFFRVRIHSNP